MVTCVRKQTIEDSFVFDMSITNEVAHVSLSVLLSLFILKKKKYM